MKRLKTCPFCGGELRMEHDLRRTDYWVYCDKCEITYPPADDVKLSEEEAAERWNTRHESVWCDG